MNRDPQGIGEAWSILSTVVFVLLLTGLAFLVYGGSRQRDSLKGTVFVSAGLLIEDISMLWLGLATAYFTYKSPRISAEGEIISLRQSAGKYPSSHFVLRTASGESISLHCRYNGPNLKTGEHLSIRYLDYGHSMLSARILDGPSRGRRLEEPEEYFWHTLLALFGGFCIFAALRERRQMRYRN